METWVELARGLDCALLIDEFYSHYVWTTDPRAPAPMSAAAHVRDVNKDPVILFDGLTKNWRYPGWRVTWTVGPRSVIDAVSSAGSFLDGGGSKPLQRAALPLFEPGLVQREAAGHPRRVPAEAGPAAARAPGPGHPGGPRAGGDVLRLGRPRRAARRRSTTGWGSSAQRSSRESSPSPASSSTSTPASAGADGPRGFGDTPASPSDPRWRWWSGPWSGSGTWSERGPRRGRTAVDRGFPTVGCHGGCARTRCR